MKPGGLIGCGDALLSDSDVQAFATILSPEVCLDQNGEGHRKGKVGRRKWSVNCCW